MNYGGESNETDFLVNNNNKKKEKGLKWVVKRNLKVISE